MRIFPAIFVLIGAFAMPPAGAATEAELTPSHKAKLLLAALSFFKSMPSDGANLNIMLLGQCPVASALREMDGKAINGLTLHFEPLAQYPGADGLRGRFDEKPYAALFDCSKQASVLERNAGLAAERRVLMLAGDEAAVLAGAALATEVRDGRPGLVLNMKTVKAAGAAFDGRLAGVARILQ